MPRVLDGITPRETVVGTGRCFCCGKPVTLRVMKSGTVYTNCRNFKDNGDPCNAHMRMGGNDSMDVQRAYVTKQKGKTDGQESPAAPPPGQPAGKPTGGGRFDPFEFASS